MKRPDDHEYYALFQDENSVRQLVKIHSTEFGGFQPIGIVGYSTFGSDPSSPAMIENGAYPIIKADEFRQLEGRLLTLCDATFSDPLQREAFKDLLKTQTREWYDKHTGYTYKMGKQLYEQQNTKETE